MSPTVCVCGAHTYLNSLTTEDLEDLFEDIKVYQSPEKGINADFW